jgi:hypothetical protein
MNNPEALSVLIRLILAHLLTDFVFQPGSWVKSRQEKRYRSTKLYLHALITAGVAYLLSGLFAAWWIFIIILVSHLLIDLWKSYKPNKLRFFVIDQLLHLIIILLLWLFTFNLWAEMGVFIGKAIANMDVLIVITGYLIIAWPLGVLIGIATEKWRNDTEVNKEGLAKAGMWIGQLERFLILTFILIDQFTAVGLLIAAKSILRFSDKENTQKKTEYVLIGTLMSFSASFVLGLLMEYLLEKV